MKKQLSVFALHARAAIGRLARVLLGMLALDAAAYVLFGLRGFRASLTGSELVTALRVIFSHSSRKARDSPQRRDCSWNLRSRRSTRKSLLRLRPSKRGPAKKQRQAILSAFTT